MQIHAKGAVETSTIGQSSSEWRLERLDHHLGGSALYSAGVRDRVERAACERLAAFPETRDIYCMGFVFFKSLVKCVFYGMEFVVFKSLERCVFMSQTNIVLVSNR